MLQGVQDYLGFAIREVEEDRTGHRYFTLVGPADAQGVRQTLASFATAAAARAKADKLIAGEGRAAPPASRRG